MHHSNSPFNILLQRKSTLHAPSCISRDCLQITPALISARISCVWVICPNFFFFCRGGEEGETEATLVKEEGNGIDKSRPHRGHTPPLQCAGFLWSTNKSVDLFHISVEKHGCAVYTVQEMRNAKISLYESKPQNKLKEEKPQKQTNKRDGF